MNAGLSNLASLKAWLLPAAMVAGTDYDAQIAAIGKGVAGQLERHCNRSFLRAEADVFECSADRLHVALPRFPVESVATLELRTDLTTGWQAQPFNDYVINQDLPKGLLWFGAMPGYFPTRIRLTYTGGFWFETLEPADADYPTTQPEGSAPLDPALLLAWQMQCGHVYGQIDKLGLQIAQKPEAAPAIAQVKLLDAVIQMVQPFVRYSLT